MSEPTDSRTTERRETTARPLAFGLAVVAGLTRLIPHPFNLTATGALGLFGGARLRSWQALLLPVVVMVLTDLALWGRLALGGIQGYPSFDPLVYASFGIYVLLGRLLTRTEAPLRIGGVVILGTVQFFLLTNLSAWLALSVPPEQLPAGQAVVLADEGASYLVPRYARNAEGLLACYALALPFNNPDAPPLGFFGNLLVGDLFFCGLLFGAHAWLSRRYFVAESQSRKRLVDG